MDMSETDGIAPKCDFDVASKPCSKCASSRETLTTSLCQRGPLRVLSRHFLLGKERSSPRSPFPPTLGEFLFYLYFLSLFFFFFWG
jgi:hypothetical protein